MADQVGEKILSHSVGGTAERDSLTKRVRQIAVVNQHATQSLFVRVSLASSVAAALAAAGTGSGVAVVNADENFVVPPANGRTVVLKSKKAVYAALSCIATGASTPYVVHGTDFTDGE